MDQLRGLPFKVGDRVELKSFEGGYRGAWFRCEIKGTDKKGVALDLYDYEEDGIHWLKSVRHKVPSKSKGKKMDLMLRPQYPPVYSEGEAPDVDSLSDPVVVTNGAWKVGDSVDWFCDGAYWSGKIIKFLENDNVQLKSPPKPMGEDLVYEGLCKDLRPSLEWSLKSGWTVPVPTGNDNHGPCARLIKPGAKESPSEQNASAYPSLGKGADKETTTVTPKGETRAEGKKKNADLKGTSSDSVSAEGRKKDADLKRSSTDSVSSAFREEQPPENEERVKLTKNIPLNSSTSDSIESLIIDMEELLNRVKWMKRILEPQPQDSANAGWKFQEYRASGAKPQLG